MSTTENTNRPTHRIYAVSKGKDDKAIWKDIGAAWPHKDQSGFNLRFEQFPLNGAQIVIRKSKPKAEATPEAQTALAA